MKQEIYKDHYQFEWDHRSHLTSATNISIAVVTIVGGVLVSMAQKYPWSQAGWSYFYGCLLIVSAVCTLLSVYFLFKSILGYTYKRIPTPLKLKSHYENLSVWHNEYGETQDDAEIDFADYFYQLMAEATEVNALNNKYKSAYLHRSNTTLAVALVFIVLSVAPYLIATINTKKEIRNVQIENPITITTEENTMADENKKDEPKTDTLHETIPEKPVGPPNEDVREGVVETEKKIIQENKQ